MQRKTIFISQRVGGCLCLYFCIFSFVFVAQTILLNFWDATQRGARIFVFSYFDFFVFVFLYLYFLYLYLWHRLYYWGATTDDSEGWEGGK